MSLTIFYDPQAEAQFMKRALEVSAGTPHEDHVKEIVTKAAKEGEK